MKHQLIDTDSGEVLFEHSALSVVEFQKRFYARAAVEVKEQPSLKTSGNTESLCVLTNVSGSASLALSPVP